MSPNAIAIAALLAGWCALIGRQFVRAHRAEVALRSRYPRAVPEDDADDQSAQIRSRP